MGQGRHPRRGARVSHSLHKHKQDHTAYIREVGAYMSSASSRRAPVEAWIVPRQSPGASAPFPPSPPSRLTLRLSLSCTCRLPDVEDLLSHCVPTTRCLSLPPHLRGPYPGPLEVPFPQELRDYTPSPLRFQSADGTQVIEWIPSMEYTIDTAMCGGHEFGVMLRSLLCTWWMLQVWLRVLAVDELLNVLREFRDRVGSIQVYYSFHVRLPS